MNTRMLAQGGALSAPPPLRRFAPATRTLLAFLALSLVAAAAAIIALPELLP